MLLAKAIRAFASILNLYCTAEPRDHIASQDAENQPL